MSPSSCAGEGRAEAREGGLVEVDEAREGGREGAGVLSPEACEAWTLRGGAEAKGASERSSQSGSTQPGSTQPGTAEGRGRAEGRSGT